jgi:2-C-methyl-D-erythritol 2,4-cyclodiphosphate synthase
MGDIGHHFPDTSSEFKGIDSKILLKRTYDMILGRGYSLVNADLTLLLQAPKVAPYIEQMRSTLASVMGVGVDAVSVKATTEERLGFTGREEGVAAYAVVLLAKN